MRSCVLSLFVVVCVVCCDVRSRVCVCECDVVRTLYIVMMMMMMICCDDDAAGECEQLVSDDLLCVCGCIDVAVFVFGWCVCIVFVMCC